MKLGVFLPNWIGDAVMATPALRAVRDHHPHAEVVGLARPYVAEVLRGTDLLDRTLLYDPKEKQGERSERSFVRRLRAERLDAALLLTNSFRTAWLAWRSGAKRRVGFARDLRGWLLTDRVTPKPKSRPHPVLDEYNRLAETLGCSTLSTRTELAVTDEDARQFESFWENRDWRLRSSGFVAMSPGGAFGAAKHWPTEHFAELAGQVVRDLDRTVLVLCGPAERDTAREITSLADDPRVLSLADGPIGLGVTKAAVREATLLVATDSGPRHFAAALGTPVVTLFGPTHISWSETHYDLARHVQLDVDCGPCQKRVCPLGHHRCMQELTPAAVMPAVRELLASGKRGAA